MLEANIESDGYPRLVPPYLPWDERIKRSAGYVSSAFTFDIAVPADCPDMGLVLRPFLLRATLRSMPCAVVEKVPGYLSSYVYPGDIVLRVNEESLVSYEQPVSFNRVVSLLSSPIPRSIRFLRPAGTAAQPSPGEAVVLATGSNVTAKFELASGSTGSPDPWTITLKAIDIKAPPVVRRVLAGNKINWEPYAKPSTTVTSAKQEEVKALGVYRERTKWVAVSRPKRPLHEPADRVDVRDRRCFFLGRFDSEAEAQRACLKAQEEVRLGRLFVSSKGGRIVPSFGTAPTPSSSASQSMAPGSSSGATTAAGGGTASVSTSATTSSSQSKALTESTTPTVPSMPSKGPAAPNPTSNTV